MTTAAEPGQLLSYQSISTAIFDVPEPEGIDGKFIYNYFLPDERVSINTSSSLETFNRHGEIYAREVHLSFTPLQAIIPPEAELSQIQMSPRQKEVMLGANVKKIIKETEFMNSAFLALQMQDSTITTRLLANVEAELLQNKIDTEALSPTETLLKYSSVTSENVDGQALLESVDIDDSNEYVTIDPTTGKPFAVSKAGDMSALTFNVVLAQKFAGDIASAAVKTPMAPAENMLRGVTEKLIEKQTEARQSINSRQVRVANYQFAVRPIAFEKIDTDDVFLGGNTVMGYRVRKSQVRKRRRRRNKFINDFFIANTDASSFVDRDVKYGVQYEYAISVIYLVRFFAFRKRSVVEMDLLVESRESPSITITCVEAAPPEAPDGLDFYLLQNGKLVLEWEFPYNPSEDIKRFQIFRRSSLKESFTLLKQLDFDDSVVQTPRSENIPSYANNVYDRPRMFFIDNDFTIKDKYIYAIAAVDAHDLGSGYSEQFEVGFDMFTGQITIDFIARKDAPKPYPNFTLVTPLTEDSIKDSGHSSVVCYFDPEYIKVIDSAGEDLHHLVSSLENPSYKLQLLHLNFQQSAVVDVNVND